MQFHSDWFEIAVFCVLIANDAKEVLRLDCFIGIQRTMYRGYQNMYNGYQLRTREPHRYTRS